VSVNCFEIRGGILHGEDHVTGFTSTSDHKHNGFKNIHKTKGKSVPLQAWSGPEDSRKLRFPDFMTTAQEGGKVVSLMHRPHLSPGNSPGIHFC
jgi:hypothetical protein